MAISWDGSPLLIPHDIGELKWKERVWKVHLEFKVAKIPKKNKYFKVYRASRNYKLQHSLSLRNLRFDTQAFSRRRGSWWWKERDLDMHVSCMHTPAHVGSAKGFQIKCSKVRFKWNTQVNVRQTNPEVPTSSPTGGELLKTGGSGSNTRPYAHIPHPPLPPPPLAKIQGPFFLPVTRGFCLR